MAEPTVLAIATTFIRVLGPMKLLTFALLAEVARKRTNFEEAKKREELADSILNRSAGKTPFIRGFKGKTCTCNTGSSLLRSISKISNCTVQGSL
jgi:hypothetical protein